MSDLLDEAVAKVRRLSPDRQLEAAELLMELADQEPADYRLSEAQLAEIRRRMAEPDYATDAEVREVFDRLVR